MASNSNPEDLLSFKEFAPVHSSHPSKSMTAEISINSPQKSFGLGGADPLDELINDMAASAKVLNADEKQQPTADLRLPGYSFLTIEYYQQFFNVDTLMVVERVVSSMIPKRAPGNYLQSHIGLNPDLYGPFWIMVTLVFSIGISGNIASYLQHASEDFHWRYNFHLVSYAATAIFIYSCFIPLALWALLKWSIKPSADDIESDAIDFCPSLLSLMCIYGYSLAIYIPVSILWVIQLSFLQWLLVITAALLSGSVLIFVLTPALRNSNISLFLIAGILFAHFALAAGFMLYFFHVPSSPNIEKLIPRSVMFTDASVHNQNHTT